MDGDNFFVDAIFTIPTAKVPAYFDALQVAYDGVIKEKECTLFEVTTRDLEGGETEIRLVEAWDATTEWFLSVQSKKEYYNAYREITIPMYTKERKIDVWTRVHKFAYSKPSKFRSE